MSIVEKPDRRTRRVTTTSTVAAMSVWCAQNKEQLGGKPFQHVAGQVRKQFNGQKVSDLAIRTAMDAAGIPVYRRKYSKGGHHSRSQARALAAILVRLVDSIERTIDAPLNTLLCEQDREALAAIRQVTIA